MDAGPIVTALVATGALIVLGLLLRRCFAEEVWRGLESLSYHVLLPALLVRELAGADVGADALRMVAVLAGSQALGAAAALLARRALGADGPAFTSTFQAAIRFNTYVGFFVAASLYGEAGTTFAALASAVLVPVANVASTLVLLRHGHHAGAGASPWAALARNPLVLACVVGAAGNVVGRLTGAADTPVLGPVLGVADRLLDLLGASALPLGLLCVGAGLGGWQGLRGGGRYAAAANVLRFGVVPVGAYALCRVTGLAGPAAVVAVLFQSLPTAPAAYVLSRALGGDARLMAAIIARQTVLACLVLPLWLLAATRL